MIFKKDITKFAITVNDDKLDLHGAHGMVDHTLYVDFWARFSDIAQVLLLDQRGCGCSDWNDASKWNLLQ